MIVEQIRYFAAEEDVERLLESRRVITRIRRQMGVPAGQVLIADEGQDAGPCAVWQCLYENEGEMGMAETRLIGNDEYEAARAALGRLSTRVEVELYLTDSESEDA